VQLSVNITDEGRPENLPSIPPGLAALEPLPPRPADIVRTISLDGGMKPYARSMNGEYWPQVTPLMLAKGNASRSIWSTAR
jgi:hypothetical protein